MSERSYWKTSSAYSWPIMVFDTDGVTPKTGLLNAAFTKKLALDDVNDATTVTVTEVDGTNFQGLYKVTYTPGSDGHWVNWVAHSTYAPQGYMDEIQAVAIASLVDLLDVATADGYTFRKFLRVALSFMGGKSSGLPTSPVFRDIADTKNRISATLDSSGNRSAVTVDGT